ncbi:DNA primase [Salinibaculum rarum]|uniref:DNA primase n=1 Tax=Salinibaculum rarum TaxID=3058903 RepID=UPI00265E1FDB|nr:DNA primase [Salinibaculum sp. KK48]
MTSDTYPWRSATPREIQTYYEEEFPDYVDDIPNWITPTGPIEYAIALTDPYPVVVGDQPTENRNSKRNFIRRSTQPDEQPEPRFNKWDDLLEFFQKPVHNDPKKGDGPPSPGLIDPKIAESSDYEDLDGVDVSTVPAADAIYYGLEHHDRFWVLVFDIDAKDVAIEDHKQKNDPRRNKQIAKEAGVRDKPPLSEDQKFSYTWDDVQQSIQYGFELKTWLEDCLEFTDTEVFYSGQGTHVYALDEDASHHYTERTRKFLMAYITEVLDIPVDTKVTPDDSRVMRLPYSLHADVSRIVTPVNSPAFDFRSDPVPEFLKADNEVEQ